MSGADVFNSFYARLRDVQKYHAKFVQTKDSVRGNVCDTVKPEVVFSGEEALGRLVLCCVSVVSVFCCVVCLSVCVCVCVWAKQACPRLIVASVKVFCGGNSLAGCPLHASVAVVCRAVPCTREEVALRPPLLR